MNGTPHDPLADDAYAEAVFVALDGLSRLAPGDDRDRGASVDFGALYRFATEPAAQMSPALDAALGASARLRADLRRLMEKARTGDRLFAAAAASGTIASRAGHCFHMTLCESRADERQVYVIIRLSEKALRAPRALFVIDEANKCRKVPLPPPSHDTIQILMDADSDIVAALRHPATEVFVR